MKRQDANALWDNQTLILSLNVVGREVRYLWAVCVMWFVTHSSSFHSVVTPQNLCIYRTYPDYCPYPHSPPPAPHPRRILYWLV